MAVSTEINANVLAKLRENQDFSEPITLKVSEIKTTANSRAKLVLTDGSNSAMGVLSSQLGPQVEDGTIAAGDIVQLTDYTASLVQNNVCLVVVDMKHVSRPENGSKSIKREAPEEHASASTPVAHQAKVAKLPHTPFQTPNHQDEPKDHPTPPTTMPKLPVSTIKRNITPILGLNPYNNQFTIKAKLIHKGNKRSITTKQGESKSLFSVELADEASSVIEATLWGELADTMYDALEVGKVYYWTKGQVKPANKQYSSVKNDYTINFGIGTEVEECSEQDMGDLQLKLEYVAFDQLPMHLGKKAPVDLLGVVVNVGPVGEIQRKSDGSSLSRRDITMVDASKKSVQVTLWGNLASVKAAQLETMQDAIVSLSNCRVGDYNGLSISSLSRSDMTINPDTPAAQQLRDWYATEGRDSGFTAVNEGLANAIRRDGSNASSRNTRTALADIVKTTNLPPVDAKPEYFTAIVTVAKIQDEQSMYYCACPENNRKVIEAPGGNGWLCEYDGQTYASMVRRYVLSALVKDHTGRAYVSIFNNDAQQLLGMSADELAELKETQENPQAQSSFKRVIQDAQWSEWKATLVTKTREYQGTLSQRVSVQALHKIDYAAESRELLGAIDRLAA